MEQLQNFVGLGKKGFGIVCIHAELVPNELHTKIGTASGDDLEFWIWLKIVGVRHGMVVCDEKSGEQRVMKGTESVRHPVEEFKRLSFWSDSRHSG